MPLYETLSMLRKVSLSHTAMLDPLQAFLEFCIQ